MDGHRMKTGLQKIWVNITEKHDRFSDTANTTEQLIPEQHLIITA